MRRILLPTATIFTPLIAPARYKGVWGGRGSGKSHFFATLLIEHCLAEPGLSALCIREVQKSLKDSVKRLIEMKLSAFGLGEAEGFRRFHDRIMTPGGGLILFQGMQDHTAESIKSLEGFGRAWVEEAQNLSDRSLELLRPTIRAAGSELWFSWNPRHRRDAVDRLLRGPAPPPEARIIRANWPDNPWFPPELEAERRACLLSEPERYRHIWEGDYAEAQAGAYYAAALAQARAEGRIRALERLPLLPLSAFWDIGLRDATALWIAQQAGAEIRLIAYYEAVGQPLSAHLNWLRAHDFASALCVLPHDGARADTLTAISFADHVRQSGFHAETVPNQGAGAALRRIEAARRLFPRLLFDDSRCAAGLEALGAYHERRDAARGIGLGPNHDWSSHAADAFGLMAVYFSGRAGPRIRA